MNTATIGARYQVVIPKQVREALNLRPASKVIMEAHNQHIVIYPETTCETLRGLGSTITDKSDPSAYVAKLRREWEHRERYATSF